MAEEVGVDPNTGTSRTNRFQDGVASRRNSSSIFGGFGWTQTNDGRVAAYCLSQLSYETIYWREMKDSNLRTISRLTR